MQSSPRLRIAICGGGIGGLALAVTIGKYADKNVHIDVYEAADAFTEVGAGISVWKRTWHIMQMLGLDTSLGKMAIHPPVDEPRPGFVLRKSDQREGLKFHQMVIPYGSITLHRADMLNVLMNNLPSSSQFQAHFSKRLVSYTHVQTQFQSEHDGYPDSRISDANLSSSSETNQVTLCFSDGTTANADILVGADGIKSATRATMYSRLAESLSRQGKENADDVRQHASSTWSGTYAFRSLVDVQALLKAAPGHQAASTPTIYLGKDKHIVSYPISQGRTINLVIFITIPDGEDTLLDGPAVVDATKEEVLEHYKGWEPEIQSLLNCIDKPSRWAISQVRGLPQYADGCVALLGDAAHAMTTHLGAGAGQAIEDAYILGRLLAYSSIKPFHIPSVLQIYDAVRRPFAGGVVERSRTTGFLYEFSGLPDGIDADSLTSGNIKELRKLAGEIDRKWELQWSDLPDVEWNKAQEMMADLVQTEKGA